MTAPRWILPAATSVLAVLGAGAVIAAAAIPGTPTSAGPSQARSTSTPAPRPTPSIGAATPGPTARPLDARATPIAELADPAWVKRIATAGGIPERALAAYAGAALRLAQTDPGCGIGWNTIAAIGLVESEHGTLQGGRIGADGVAAPEIIGIPIGPDTDRGRLDRDPAQDHAVGPMQFIPSSWNLLGEDGDLDGAKDVHHIDDAALAAGIHLCEVGGDLAQPSNWINAVNAYNSSVEYNNRVAAAASGYAALR